MMRHAKFPCHVWPSRNIHASPGDNASYSWETSYWKKTLTFFRRNCRRWWFVSCLSMSQRYIGRICRIGRYIVLGRGEANARARAVWRVAGLWRLAAHTAHLSVDTHTQRHVQCTRYRVLLCKIRSTSQTWPSCFVFSKLETRRSCL